MITSSADERGIGEAQALDAAGDPPNRFLERRRAVIARRTASNCALILI
jgi:hypothetical protein